MFDFFPPLTHLPVPANDNRFQIMDLLRLSHREQKLRRLCREALANRRIWKREDISVTAPAFELHRVEGALLDLYAAETVRVYGLLRQERARCFEAYVQRLRPAQNSFAVRS